MQLASVFKALGYLVSSLSVVLLGIVAWKSASEEPLLFACLVGGMLASISGMALRWISHRIEQRDKQRIEAKAESRRSTAQAPGPALAQGVEGA
jgi:hypothetical protein